MANQKPSTKLYMSDGNLFPTPMYAIESIMGTAYIKAKSWEEAVAKYNTWVDTHYRDDVRFVLTKAYLTKEKPDANQVLLDYSEWDDDETDA